MVCWPLRSAQNKGSGTTVYSLGGYGTYNGTLSSGPTWGSTGIVFNNTAQQIDVSYSSLLLLILSSYSVFYTTNNSFNQYHLILDTFVDTGYYIRHKFDGQSGFGTSGVAGITTRNSTAYRNQSLSRSINLTTFQSSAYCVANTSDTTYQDGVVAISGLQTGLPARNPTGTPVVAISANSSSKIHAFQAIFSTTLTDSENSQLNSLYKTTLGTGLGLP